MQLLLDARAAVNGADTDGKTTLHRAAETGHTAAMRLLLDTQADVNAADAHGLTPGFFAAGYGHTEAMQCLLPVPQLAAEAKACAARAAAECGHAALAIMTLKAMGPEDGPSRMTAATVLGQQSVAVEVLRQLEAADGTIRELAAPGPALQELLIGIAATHQQLQSAAADITAAAVNAAVQAARQVSGRAAGEAAVAAAASAAAAAAIAAVAPLAQDAAPVAAAAAPATATAATTVAFPAKRQRRTHTAMAAVGDAQIDHTASEVMPTKRITRSASRRPG